MQHPLHHLRSIPMIPLSLVIPARPSVKPDRSRPAWMSFRLPATIAFWLQVSVIVFLLAASSAPTPLYPVYQAAWGFSPIITTVIFGIYALAVLGSLLIVGSLSDYVGRRPVLIAALALQAATMLLFATADGVIELLVARVLQGLSTGAAVGALGAGLLDLNRARGTVANAVGPMVGTATGGIGSGLLVQFLPAPTQLVYAVLFVIFAVQTVGVILMRESATPKVGALASLRPQFSLPAAVRAPLLLVTPALIAVWALVGFYASLGPTLVRSMLATNSFLIGGLALFAFAASGAVMVLLVRSLTPRTMLLLGVVTLLAGVGVTLFAVTRASGPVFFLGTAVAGAGFGAAFQGALQTVMAQAAAHERAGVLSILFVVSYLAMGLPAVFGGFMAVYSGVVMAGLEYGAGVLVLTALALVGLLVQREQTAAPVLAVSGCAATALPADAR
jgi:predicted MFS family arabinose efflux permease